MDTTPPPFFLLGKDVLVFISMRYLSLEDTAALSSTCSSLRCILNAPAVVERRVKLWIVGMDVMDDVIVDNWGGFVGQIKAQQRRLARTGLAFWQQWNLMYESIAPYGKHWAAMNLLKYDPPAYCSEANTPRALLLFQSTKRGIVTHLHICTAGGGYTSPCKDLLVWLFPGKQNINETQFERWWDTTEENWNERQIEWRHSAPTVACWGLTKTQEARSRNVLLQRPVLAQTMVVMLLRPVSGTNVDHQCVIPEGLPWPPSYQEK